MAQDPKQGIAGTSERINHHEMARQHVFCNRGNVEANTVSECVTRALYRCAAQNTNSTSIPFFRLHSVNAYVARVCKAIDSVLLNVCETQYFIAFTPMKHQCSIIDLT